MTLLIHPAAASSGGDREQAGIFSDRDTAFEGHEAPEGRPKHPSQ